MTDLVRYKKPPAEIPRALARKQELTLREEAWVYNDLIGLVIGLMLLIVGLWYLILPLTMSGLGIATTVVGGMLTLERGAEWFTRSVSSSRSPLGNGYHGNRRKLRRSARRELVLMDRNRKRRTHKGEYGYSEHQFSCWPTNIGGEGVAVMLLEHKPGPFWCPYWDVQVANHNGTDAIRRLGKRPSGEQLREAVEELEEVANQIEAVPHMDKVAEYESLASILEVRR
jgi:hypothetical protein